MKPKEFYCTYGHRNCSSIDKGSCSDELESKQDLEQRVKDMVEQDKITGEHKDATPLDYIRWAIEEVELNKEDE